MCGNSTRGCGTYHLFYASGAHQIQEPDSGDLEELELLLWTRAQVETAIDQGQAKSLGVMTMLLMGLRCLVQTEIPDVFILCGGQGTRFRAVREDIPKALAPINGVPFLDLLLGNLLLKDASGSSWARVI